MPATRTARSRPPLADTLAIGMQQGPRPEQQDCGAALLWVPRFGFSLRCAAVIADGMGGMKGGGWASRHAVAVVVERCLSGDHDTPRDMLASALEAAQREVLEALRGRGGTTLTAAVWDRRGGMLVHIGDTRAHLVEPGRPFRCLTADHTEAGHADALDRLTTGRPDEPYRPTGPDSSLIDVIGVPDGILAERHVLHTPRDGRYVLTSDGAHDPVRRAGNRRLRRRQRRSALDRPTQRRGDLETPRERVADRQRRRRSDRTRKGFAACGARAAIRRRPAGGPDRGTASDAEMSGRMPARGHLGKAGDAGSEPMIEHTA